MGFFYLDTIFCPLNPFRTVVKWFNFCVPLVHSLVQSKNNHSLMTAILCLKQL